MKDLIKHVMGKIKEVGLKNLFIGLMRRNKLRAVCKAYGLDAWHQSPFELRLYAQMAANSANELNVDCVVEVGCGLGEILRHINAKRAYGYDIDPNVVKAANAIKPTDKIQYHIGELKDVAIGDIDCLITISWMHYVSEAYLKEAYKTALEQNRIKYVIVDVKNIENKRRDFSEILPSHYHCISRKKYQAVESEIWIEVYKCEES